MLIPSLRVRTTAVVAVCLLLLGSLSRPSLATPIVTPSGLIPGDQFRIVFVSSATRDALSTVIGDYDTFIDNLATAAALTYNGVDVTWFAIGSTPTVAANSIGRLPASPTSPALYRLDGVQVADHTSDLWDGELDAPINVDELVSGGIAADAWTGSNLDGGPHILGEFGTTFGDTIYGRTASTTIWTQFSSQAQANQLRVYGYSEVLTVSGAAVVPEPATVTLVLVGIATWAGASLGRRRRAKSPA